jgi:hypothetical protein
MKWIHGLDLDYGLFNSGVIELLAIFMSRLNSPLFSQVKRDNILGMKFRRVG